MSTISITVSGSTTTKTQTEFRYWYDGNLWWREGVRSGAFVRDYYLTGGNLTLFQAGGGVDGTDYITVITWEGDGGDDRLDYKSNFGYQSSLNNTGIRTNAFGYQALRNNSGDQSNGFGTFALEGNSGIQCNGMGYNALADNTGEYCNGMGHAAVKNNTGKRCNGIGFSVLQNNTGDYCDAIGYNAMNFNTGDDCGGFGFSALSYNKGARSYGFGYYNLRLNAGDDCIGFGYRNLENNYGAKNTAIGGQAFNAWVPDAGSAQTFANTDIDAGTDAITITGHGFGANDTYVVLKWTATTGTLPAGITLNQLDQFLIQDVNTIVLQSDNMTDQGTGNHTLTPPYVYENATAIGYNAEPDSSNQVVLGDGNVTEVKTAGALNIGGNQIIDASAFFRPVSSADAAAPNNSVYYSTDQSKLVYKDSGGGINNLY